MTMSNIDEEWIHPYIRKIEKRILDDSGTKYRFEKCFDLVNDATLLRAGVSMCAVTEVDDGDIRNKIVFRKGDAVSDLNCVHTTVCQIVLDPESEEGVKIVSTEERADLRSLLSPEEHYVAMKSYVGYLAETGIQNCFVIASKIKVEQDRAPLDFNHLMQQQVIQALFQIAPGELNSIPDWTDYVDFDYRISLAVSDHLSEDAIRVLANDEEFEVRIRIAGRESLPEDLIRTLAKDEYPKVRIQIAQREILPENLIRSLVKDEYPKVRIQIAQREILPEDLIRSLTEDEDCGVRRQVAERKSLPEDLIRTLAKDEDPKVRLQIAQRETLLEDLIRTLAKDEYPKVRIQIAQREILPEEVVRVLIEDESRRVRFQIAKRRILPRDVIRSLIKDEDTDVRARIARRETLPEGVLRSLA